MLIDAVMFGGELDVLQARLRELDPVVDKFVVVEALEHHGSPAGRSPVLAENWAAVRDFEHKVKYYVLPRLEPPHSGPNDSWPRENFHRNAIMTPAAEVAGIHLGASWRDALLMVSDCDEIPRASTVAGHLHDIAREPHAFNQDFFYYNVNNYVGTWNGTVAWTVGGLLEATPQGLRNRRDSLPRLADGGWHFSYFGGLDRVIHKLGNFAHACEDSSRLVLCRGRETIAGDLLSGADIYQRPGEGRKERRSHDDGRLPSWLRANMPVHFTEDGLREALCRT